MTQRTDSAYKVLRYSRQRLPIAHANATQRKLQLTRSLVVQSLSCVGSLGILSSGLVWAQTETSPSAVVELPTKDANPPAAAPVEFATPKPATTAAALVPVRLERTRTEFPTSRASSSSVDRIGSVTTLSKPIARPVQVRPTLPLAKTTTNSATDYDGSYIDPTKYSIGATSGYQAPSQVVVMERSTGCKTVLRPGQGLSSNLCGATAVPRFSARHSDGNQAVSGYTTGRSEAQPSRWTNRSQNVALTGLPPVPIGPISVSSSGFSATPRTPATAQGPIALSDVGSMALPGTVTLPPRGGLLGYQQFPQAEGQQNNANTGLQFPLTIPAPITSIFGWRPSPFTGGGSSFHPGTDLGAPLGTPVLAAYAGDVVVANYMGGYGLAVVLEHKKPAEQTLYGHLSQIFVQPGQWVQQGTVIGRVGSTGMSTGPHLHFEIRQMTPEGWVATDAGAQLEYAMAQLVQALRTAQVPQRAIKGG